MLARDRILGRRNDRQLFAKRILEAGQVVSQTSDVFLGIAYLKLVLYQSQKATDLGNRSTTTKACATGIVLHVANGTETTPKTRKALQARTTKETTATRRSSFGLTAHCHRGVKASAVTLECSNVVEQGSLG